MSGSGVVWELGFGRRVLLHELELSFDPAVVMEEKIIFSKYVHEHLLQHARDVAALPLLAMRHASG